jgi:hypothetical protein
MLPMSRDEEAERNILISIMAIADTATKRKKMILEALEKSNVLTGSEHTTSLRVMKENQAWLLANLEQTNRTLDSALLHMQVMYGKGYSKSKG